MNNDHFVSWLRSMTDAELMREYMIRAADRKARGQLMVWTLADLVEAERKRRVDERKAVRMLAAAGETSLAVSE